MTEIFSLLIITSLLSMMLFFLIRRILYRESGVKAPRGLYVLLSSTLVLLVLEYTARGNVVLRMSADLSVAAVPLMFMASAVWSPAVAVWSFRLAVAVQLCSMLNICLQAAGVSGLSPDRVSLLVSPMVSIAFVLLLGYSVWLKVRSIRDVIKGVGVPLSLGLYVDLVYSGVIVMLSTLVQMSAWLPPGTADVLSYAVCLAYACTLGALCVRIGNESYFALLHGHETRIFESLKVSQIGTANDGKEEMYRRLYDRIVDYFEEDKPFLDANLTINGLARVVFSNKVYISRAISQFTGRNFCQFVNYYRIAYSMEVFRQNPDTKITSLAQICGFNSVVSYNMAFRLFMDENPSDWCRKERQKLRKRK